MTPNLTVVDTPSPDAVLPSTWRIWRDDPADGAENMATDLAMLRAVAPSPNEAPGDPTTALARLYGWTHPTVSFGRHERTSGQFDPRALDEAGFHVVRRPTGGRALLHDAELTYAVAMPLARGRSWRLAYDAVNTLLLRALLRLGVPASLASAPALPLRPDGPLCFEAPDAGEIVLDGRKLVGSAVWRERGAYLQHGSILIADRQPLLAAVMRDHGPVIPAATLESYVPHHAGWSDIASGFLRALREVTSEVGSVTADVDRSSLRAESEAARQQFLDPAWTWRH